MKIGVLTDPESAAGYRLAGLDVAVATNATEAEEALTRMIREGSYALVAVSLALLPDPSQAVKREMRGRNLPVLLSAPSPLAAGGGEGEAAEAYVRRLIAATMGYEIKLQ
jgi:V/A-type H+/Na+-transporting ATPase subunit F